MARALIRGIAALCAFLVSAGSGAAEALPDPTRPPAILADPVVRVDKGRTAAEALVLQSVLVSPVRKVAVISGAPLVPGSRIQNHTLVDVTATSAVLDGPEGRVELKLFGGTDSGALKTPHGAPGTRAPSRGTHRP